MRSSIVLLFFVGLLLVFINCVSISNKEEGNLSLICENKYPSESIEITTHSEWTRGHYPKRIAEFKKNPLKDNDIVFLGNSITEQGGDWSIKVSNLKAKNRGISGDTTEGVLARLGEISCAKPSKIFLLIGINDLFRDYITPSLVSSNIIKITNQLHKDSPNTKIYLQTILPTTEVKLVEKIKSTNLLLKEAEQENPYKMVFLHNHFTNSNGLMNMELSNDGVHLNDKGYQTWINQIKNLVNDK